MIAILTIDSWVDLGEKILDGSMSITGAVDFLFCVFEERLEGVSHSECF